MKRLVVLMGVWMAVWGRAWAAKTTEVTSGSNFWSATAWNNGVPEEGDTVIIRGTAVVILTNSPPPLASLTITNTAVLIMDGWDTTITADAVNVHATITHMPNNDTNGIVGNVESWALTGRIRIVCTNLLVGTSGKVLADALGFPGGTNQLRGYGPGAGAAGFFGGGAGHGGAGYPLSGGGTGGVYGTASEPIFPGSGGGGGNAGVAGRGGGAVHITALGTVVVHGIVSANGQNGATYYAGGGSGGSIYIQCKTLAGSNGVISANGGDNTGDGGSGGGGGRIAIVYDPESQATQNLLARPSIQIRANPGWVRNRSPGPPDGTGGWPTECWGRPGTIWLPDAQILPSEQMEGGVLLLGSSTNFHLNSLTITNGILIFPPQSRLIISNNLTITSARGVLEMSNSVLQVGGHLRVEGPLSGKRYPRLFFYGAPDNGSYITIGGDFILTNEAGCYLFSGPTNTSGYDHGLLVAASGRLEITSGSWIYPFAHPTNGAAPYLRVSSCWIGPNSGINADGGGYGGKISDGTTTNRGWGPGGGLYTVYAYGGGAGYGGNGGGTSIVNGIRNGFSYGESNQPPFFPGSGGGPGSVSPGSGGFGGGLIRLEVAGPLYFYGTMTASARDYNSWRSSTYFGGGGSGGGIWIQCGSFVSTGGILRANGGRPSASAGGGGGGRIAVFRGVGELPGPVVATVSGATQQVAWPAPQPGTVHWGWLRRPGTLVVIR